VAGQLAHVCPSVPGLVVLAPLRGGDLRLRLGVEVEAAGDGPPRRRGVLGDALVCGQLLLRGRRRCRGGRREVLPGEAGAPGRRARGRSRGAGPGGGDPARGEPAGGVPHAAEYGVELLDLGVGHVVDADGGRGFSGRALALGRAARRVHGHHSPSP
uniref:Uncharacterized protein n=1 Tax=Triticum urartu TaxID=4572 RepID=A0A8R7PNP6_TRIUA